MISSKRINWKTEAKRLQTLLVAAEDASAKILKKNDDLKKTNKNFHSRVCDLLRKNNAMVDANRMLKSCCQGYKCVFNDLFRLVQEPMSETIRRNCVKIMDATDHHWMNLPIFAKEEQYDEL